MRSPDLRTRLLTSTLAIVLLTLVIAFVITRQMREQLLEQIDDRLQLIAANAADGPGNSSSDRPPPTSERGIGGGPTPPEDVFEGTLSAGAEFEAELLAAPDGVELPPPVVDLETAQSSNGRPVTLGPSAGSVRYRAIATSIDDGTYSIIGLPLDGVDATMSRLVRVLGLSVFAIVLGLAAANWWVIRLGIAPLRRMTRTAEAISAGDLSERLADVDERTEAGQLGRAFNTMLGRIETSFDERLRAEERLRRFLADASHELRTPVATVRGYAELYRAGALAEQADLDDAMRRTEQESLRMSRLIHEMLELAELDRSPTISTTSVDLTAVVLDAVRDASARTPGRRIDAATPRQPLVMQGDADLIRQVVTNLVANAVIHTAVSSGVSVALWADIATAHITVADDGTGMSAETVRRATERFFRADKARSRANGGSGLGLAIVDAAVAAHGGELMITSSLGSGTEVHVQLPLERSSGDSY